MHERGGGRILTAWEWVSEGGGSSIARAGGSDEEFAVRRLCTGMECAASGVQSDVPHTPTSN